MEKIIIHHRSAHHAQNSGYGRLADYLKGWSLPYLDSKFPYAVAKSCSRQFDQKAGTYDTMSFIKDYELSKMILCNSNKKRIIHYLNAERDIRLAISLAKIIGKNKIIGTFHKPPETFKTDLTNHSYFKKLDGIIAVGENQVSFLRDLLKIDKVKFIPHGIDTQFFMPNSGFNKNGSILFVGQHLRDFGAFNYAIPRIKEKIPSLKINVIIHNEFIREIKYPHLVNIYTGIDDYQLLSFYREASLLFLPLKDVTACNSVLEAMSVGLPIISTDVGSNSFYIKEANGILLPKKDYIALTDAVIDLYSNKELIIEMGYKSRLNALNYDWKIIADQVEKFYLDL